MDHVTLAFLFNSPMAVSSVKDVALESCVSGEDMKMSWVEKRAGTMGE